jgi:beta-glucosidase
VGNHPTCNAGWNVCASPSDGKEAIDRKTLKLDQEKLVEQLYAVNPKLVVVMQASFPYTIGWIDAHVSSILEITHNSEEQGTGLADVLFGNYNPAGRLTQTWVASEDQLPPMMDYGIRHGRTYEYLKGRPLYAFGFGRSYTTFAYSNLRLSANEIRQGDTLRVSVDVKNTGSRAGDEVVQMYVRHEGSRVSRPLEELKGFRRVSLGPGQTRTVELELPAEQLRYWDEAKHRWVLEPDKVRVMVGAASNDIKLAKSIKTGIGQ